MFVDLFYFFVLNCNRNKLIMDYTVENQLKTVMDLMPVDHHDNSDVRGLDHQF